MNKEFERFLEYQGRAVIASQTLGVTKQRIYQIKSGMRIGVNLAKKIVDQYPSIDLYDLLYKWLRKNLIVGFHHALGLEWSTNDYPPAIAYDSIVPSTTVWNFDGRHFFKYACEPVFFSRSTVQPKRTGQAYLMDNFESWFPDRPWFRVIYK